MKRLMIAVMGGLAVAVLLSTASVQGAIETRTYYFTGADLLNNVFVAGADNSTPVQNELYSGARSLRVGQVGRVGEDNLDPNWAAPLCSMIALLSGFVYWV